jgi:organic radical activating enzyme
MLPVMEHFYTLQGEGAFHAGKAAYFIRSAVAMWAVTGAM